MLRIIITGPAKQDIQAAHDWWANNRSVEQAARWYLGIQKAIASLKKCPPDAPCRLNESSTNMEFDSYILD